LPGQIDELETKQAELTQLINDPSFYKKDQTVINKTMDELKQAEQSLEQLIQRWDELENLA